MDEEQSIDLRELLDIILRNLKTIGKITLGFIILAILYLIIASPVYESTALLRVKQQQGLGDSLLNAAVGGSTQLTQQRMSTYAEILKSRSVVVPVIAATEKKDDKGKYPDYDSYVKGRITTIPFKNTEILQLSVTARTPEGAQKANQLLVNGFLNRLTNLSRIEQTATKNFLDQRTNEAKSELTKAENAMQAYKAANGIISPDDNAKIFSDRIAAIDKAASENQVDLGAAQARLNAVNGQLGSAGKATADNTTLKEYNSQLAKLEMTRVGYLDKYTAKHPKMQEIDNQIGALKQKIANETARVAALQAPSDNAVHQGLLAGKFESEGQIAIAQQKAAELNKIKAKNDAELAQLPAKEQGFVRVMRDATVAQDIYVMLAKRLEEAKVAEVMVANDVQVVDTATLPEKPIRPRKALTLVLAALLGILAGCAYCIGGELLNKRIKTEADIAFYLELPVLGAVPEEATLKEAMDKQAKYGNKQSLTERLRRFLWRK